MNPLGELFRYHAWATLQLIDYCQRRPAALLHELVLGTDRSILHTLTHLVGTEQSYLELLTGEPAAEPILRGETLAPADLRPRFERLLGRWQAALERIDELDVVLPATEHRPAIEQGQALMVVQAIQHGMEHRTQICSTFAVLGHEPPIIDGWMYWDATHRT